MNESCEVCNIMRFVAASQETSKLFMWLTTGDQKLVVTLQHFHIDYCLDETLTEATIRIACEIMNVFRPFVTVMSCEQTVGD